MLDYQWTLLGLNQRPSDYESDALTDWAKGPKIGKRQTADVKERRNHFLIQVGKIKQINHGKEELFLNFYITV